MQQITMIWIFVKDMGLQSISPHFRFDSDIQFTEMSFCMMRAATQRLYGHSSGPEGQQEKDVSLENNSAILCSAMRENEV